MSRQPPHLAQRGIEAALLVPVALVGAVRRQLPKLVQRLSNGRVIGRMAVDEGVRRASTLVRDSEHLSAPIAPLVASLAPEVDTETSRPAQPVPGAPAAITDYSSLAASQVVSLLNGLSPTELNEVREYEEATRRRRTILAAVERLRR